MAVSPMLLPGSKKRHWEVSPSSRWFKVVQQGILTDHSLYKPPPALCFLRIMFFSISVVSQKAPFLFWKSPALDGRLLPFLFLFHRCWGGLLFCWQNSLPRHASSEVWMPCGHCLKHFTLPQDYLEVTGPRRQGSQGLQSHTQHRKLSSEKAVP